ncbi:MAG: DUF4097 family beta strand repeat protein [Oscillospiraceae bacterium]|nr:DUF4097 family beta strand repeat protein [Oscillospiraceae bacterium]
MKKKIISLSVCLIVVGLAVAAAGLIAVDFDFTKLSLARLTSNVHSVEGAFTDISIDTDISDVRFELSQDSACQVICLEEVNYFHRVSVENNTLTITTEDNRRWYEHIGINFGDFHSVTIRLPKQVYKDLTVNCRTADVEIPKDFSFHWADITTTTGDVKWQGSEVDTLSVDVSTGDILVKDIALCKNITAKTSTGDITLSNSIATNDLIAKTGTGDVLFDRFDAGSMEVKTTTGDVTGTLLSYKRFTVYTDTGKLRLPPMPDEKTTLVVTDENGKVLGTSTPKAGPCNITTTTGDIDIALS